MQPRMLPEHDAPTHGRGRLSFWWRAAHEPVPGVSRRTQLVAYAVPFAVLPSSLWRLPAAFDRGIGVGERLYVVFLSVFSEALAFTAIGLIARWGEVFPRRIPVLGGRPVPPKAAVIPAAIGATLLTLLWTVLAGATQIMGKTVQGDDLPADFPSEVGGWQAASFYLCYTPLMLWGPLLAILTIAYSKRRNRSSAHPTPAWS